MAVEDPAGQLPERPAEPYARSCSRISPSLSARLHHPPRPHLRPPLRYRRVQRCALLISLAGFKPSLVPYVCECITILRRHYPGRLGVACLYNMPPYWYAFWRIFCGLFDEEIMSKVHFLDVTNAEDAIAWCDSQQLAPFADLRQKV